MLPVCRPEPQHQHTRLWDARNMAHHLLSAMETNITEAQLGSEEYELKQLQKSQNCIISIRAHAC
jgi:hypothetical protein